MEVLKVLWGLFMLVYFVWTIYLFVKIAGHVGAWPF